MAVRLGEGQRRPLEAKVPLLTHKTLRGDKYVT